MGDALTNYWADYAGWGRATRSEYWWCALFYSLIIGTVLMAIPGINILWFLATIVPGFCLTARRLHDTNRSNWNVLWLLLPIVGWIVLLVFYCTEGDAKANRFGKPRI